MLRVGCGCDRFDVDANDGGGNASWGEVSTSESGEEYRPPKSGQLRCECARIVNRAHRGKGIG